MHEKNDTRILSFMQLILLCCSFFLLVVMVPSLRNTQQPTGAPTPLSAVVAPTEQTAARQNSATVESQQPNYSTQGPATEGTAIQRPPTQEVAVQTSEVPKDGGPAEPTAVPTVETPASPTVTAPLDPPVRAMLATREEPVTVTESTQAPATTKEPEATGQVAALAPAPEPSAAKDVWEVACARLTTAVNAPVDGTEYPAVFTLQGPVIRTDGTESLLTGAKMLATAQAATAAKAGGTDRTLFQLEQIVLEGKGSGPEYLDVEGWVVNDSGERGLAGSPTNKPAHQVISRAQINALLALNSGIILGNAAALTFGTTAETERVLGALATPTQKLALAFADRREDRIPVVETLSGAQVSAVFRVKGSGIGRTLGRSDIAKSEEHARCRRTALATAEQIADGALPPPTTSPNAAQ